jgi:hypothetical protein
MSFFPREEYAFFNLLVSNNPLSHSPLKPAVPAEKRNHISLLQPVIN